MCHENVYWVPGCNNLEESDGEEGDEGRRSDKKEVGRKSSGSVRASDARGGSLTSLVADIRALAREVAVAVLRDANAASNLSLSSVDRIAIGAKAAAASATRVLSERIRVVERDNGDR